MSRPGENVDRILASSASGVTLLIIVQIASRLFTFIANQLILRTLSPAILGIGTQLELYFISILYFSRESIRTAIQRQPFHGASASAIHDGSYDQINGKLSRNAQPQTISSQSVVNMSYLSISMGVPSALIFATLYTQFASREVSETPFYLVGVAITTVASLMELCVEPFFAVVQQYTLYKKRAIVETAAAFMKSLTVCGLFSWSSWKDQDLGVLPFALGYLCYSLSLICGYYLTIPKLTSRWQFSLLLTKIRLSDNSIYLADRFPRHLVTLSTNVFFQSIVKHLLTQGDAMMLAAMTSLKDQGIYSLASNYGGLAARVLFQPIEENSRAVFSSLLNSGKQYTNNVSAAKAHLIEILRAYEMLAVFIFPLGPYLVPRILSLLGGHRWASPEVGSLLSLYCYYIPFLAFNGITEAFVSSAASASDLRRQAYWMGLFSASFALAAYLFLKIGGLGAHGLVWANIFNMAVRTAWSFMFLRSYFCLHGSNLALSEFCLRPQTWIAAALSSVILARQGHDGTDYRSSVKALMLCTGYSLLM
ncbi:Rft protein-domain-containing protein [Aspergillus pseudonomiae]|uniref:Man(5)GlcNAc(2)-PP-dolichol translocation protein RFT1 n=1 Tax=Aspergillus pseudonomiae TaxID=1506151 RepID=A0A5N6ID03_9EURO|nr:Rft protein-domain-containing protein [Aspergillus pseudonomiae]KAB8263729.1 Rft protein-domain-containing protein [Aspergillus pseudonomiae]KAE8400435.1 Rft protein-domain-containing protein [Aspergillus pseudonomiae]